MSVASEITRIQGLVSSLRTKIQSKGVTLANDADLEDCVDAVDDIEGGGGGGGEEYEYFTIENIGTNGDGTGDATDVINMRFITEDWTNGVLNWTYNLEYSYDKVFWTSVAVEGYGSNSSPATTTICNISTGQKVFFRSYDTRHRIRNYTTRTSTAISTYKCNKYFYITGNAFIKVSGSIYTLTRGEDGKKANSPGEYEFERLFYNNMKIKDASELYLGESTAEGCFSEMFGMSSNVSHGNLVNPPILTAKYLQYLSCYRMFYYQQVNNIKCLSTSWSTTVPGATPNWLLGCSSSGTFTKTAGVAWTVDSDGSGIPSGWTVVEV